LDGRIGREAECEGLAMLERLATLADKESIPSTLALPSVKYRSHSSFTKERGRVTEAKGCMGTMWMPWISSGAVPKYACTRNSTLALRRKDGKGRADSEKGNGKGEKTH
jgi:hypothetical protein